MSRRRIFVTTILGTLSFVITFSITLWLITPGIDITKLPRAAVGQTFQLGKGKDIGLLVSGWGDPEDWGAWSKANDATIAFVAASDMRFFKLTFGCRAFLPPQIPQQRVEFWSGRTLLGVQNITTGETTFTIPVESGPKKGEAFVLNLVMPNARSPQELGLSSDSRKLGIGIHNIRLDP
jgi:hypothetical protein